MGLSVEVVVPFRGGCPHRERAWKWCRERYEWPVVEARLPGMDSEEGSQGADDSKPSGSLSEAPWIKALAVMPAVERSEAEIIVLADADVWTDGLSEAVRAVQNGAVWTVPHQMVYRLTEDATKAYIAGERAGLKTTRRPYWGLKGGGCVIARRETFLEVPMDPRFIGWGNEDWSHGLALRTLKGHAWQGTASLIHLFHPLQGRMDYKHGSPENFALWNRYNLARFNPTAMQALLEEARDALKDHQPALYDHP